MKVTTFFIFNALAKAADIVAETKQGTFHGIKVHERVNGFLGIPYAQPPVGDLRFQPPRPIQVEDTAGPSYVNATAFGPSCHQFMYRFVLGNASKVSTPQSEDCLTLNIYVPAGLANTPTKALPVYVWAHGGAFGEGGGSVPLYDPAAFVTENKDIIVVTLNYRLTIFGFPNSPALQHQNLGLRDQRLALEWVRDHIGSFGGDASRIVLGGESAGSMSAHSVVYAYPQDPIASGLLLQSGTMQASGALSTNADFEFVRVAEAVGCLNNVRAEELECMRGIDADTLQHAISNQSLNEFGSPHGGWPMVDNVTVFANEEYDRRGKTGEFARLPILLGTMFNEGDSLVYWDPCTGINKTEADMVTKRRFECPAALEAGSWALNNVPVWRYIYRGTFLDVEMYPWLRAYHSADIPLLMGTYSLLHTNYTSPQTQAAAKFIQNLFGTFVRDPAHGLRDIYGLPTYEVNRKTLIELFPDNKPTLTLAEAIEDTACSE